MCEKDNANKSFETLFVKIWENSDGEMRTALRELREAHLKEINEERNMRVVAEKFHDCAVAERNLYMNESIAYDKIKTAIKSFEVRQKVSKDVLEIYNRDIKGVIDIPLSGITWKYDRENEEIVSVNDFGMQNPIAVLEGESVEETDATARLICASPLMYEILRTAIEVIKDANDVIDEVENIKEYSSDTYKFIALSKSLLNHVASSRDTSFDLAE